MQLDFSLGLKVVVLICGMPHCDCSPPSTPNYTSRGDVGFLREEAKPSSGFLKQDEDTGGKAL